MSELFSLQGKIYSATRDTVTGKPKNHVWLGNAPVATLELTTEKSDKFESFSGNRLLYGSLQKSKAAAFSCTLDEFTAESLALGLYGTAVAVATGSATAEAFPSGLVIGNKVQLAKKFASAIVLTDSTGSPQTLTLGAHYSVESAAAGIIKILSLSTPTLVQPIKAAYTYADASNLAMFTNVAPPERYIVFDGINTVSGDKIVVELFRMQFDPVTGFALINDDWGGIELKAAALYDTINAADSNLGGFGRIVLNRTLASITL